MKLRIVSLEIRMINLIMLLTKEKLELENKLNIGKDNTMILNANTLIFNQNLKKKKLYGKANLNSWRNKKKQPRKTKKKD